MASSSSGAVLPPVDNLSDDADDDDYGSDNEVLKPVSTLSDSDEEVAGRRKRKRKSQSNQDPGKLSLAQKFSSGSQTRLMVGKSCGHCKGACFSQFQAPSAFHDLFTHRQGWGKMHKVDQDSVVSEICLLRLLSSYLL